MPVYLGPSASSSAATGAGPPGEGVVGASASMLCISSTSCTGRVINILSSTVEVMNFTSSLRSTTSLTLPSCMPYLIPLTGATTAAGIRAAMLTPGTSITMRFLRVKTSGVIAPLPCITSFSVPSE